MTTTVRTAPFEDLLEALDATVQDVFGASVSVSSARSQCIGPVADRLDAALDLLDRAVQDLRTIAKVASLADDTRQASADGAPLDVLMGEACGALDELQGTLTTLWATALSKGADGAETRASLAAASRLVRQAGSLLGPRLLG